MRHELTSRGAARGLRIHQGLRLRGRQEGWLAAGLSAEGERAGEIRSGDLARRDAPTCSPDDTIAELDDRDGVGEWGLAVVVDERRVVHGLVSAHAIRHSPLVSPVEDVMALGPTTVRPSQSIESAIDLMDDLGADLLLVTTELGELWGVLHRDDATGHVESTSRQHDR